MSNSGIVVSGEPLLFAKGYIRVSCKGGTSLLTANQLNIGDNNISGVGVSNGIIADGFIGLVEVGSPDVNDTVYTFTTQSGTPVISYVWVGDNK